jgi:hypothetical protein
MEYKRVLFYCIIILLVGCTRPISIYNNIAIIDNQILAFNDSVSIPYQKVYNGNFKLNINGTLYKEGVYNNAMNIGEWNYFVSPNKKFIINWNLERDTWYAVKLSVPKHWEEMVNIETPTVAFYNIKPDINREFIEDNYVSIMVHSSIGDKSLNGYNEYYNENMSSKKNTDSDHFLITIDGYKYFFNRFIFKKDGDQIIVLNLNAKLNDSIVDITMNKTDFNPTLCQIEFFELLRTVKVNNNLVFPHIGIIEMQVVD